MKTDWKKPEMIILARGKPEEAILLGCKIDFMHITPTTWHQDCQGTEASCQVCRLIDGS